eukprot:TRINITY_DN50073_c0_g1_i1.p1 TRINITY_DN50073_c0_g1~~TRINITY_DN50073_c0_g1_i1.p1  ORF type:complete len:276 (-),score=37.44 TRINITY_DN50073_c0_g1_i1:69-896(-)
MSRVFRHASARNPTAQDGRRSSLSRTARRSSVVRTSDVPCGTPDGVPSVDAPTGASIDFGGVCVRTGRTVTDVAGPMVASERRKGSVVSSDGGRDTGLPGSAQGGRNMSPAARVLASTKTAGGIAAAARLTEAQLTELHDLFRFVDTDGSGSISVAEFAGLLKLCGLDATPSEVGDMFREVDSDASGTITFGEFTAVLAHRSARSYTPEDLAAAFRVFETMDVPTGVVRRDVLQYAFRTYGERPLSNEDAADLAAVMDPSGMGQIKYSDLVRLMM